MGIYKETTRKYMVGHQMRQVVSNNGVLDLAQFYLDATAMGATQDKSLFEAELTALPDLAKNEAETILVPGIYKKEKLYGINGATKGLVEFDFSRESSATYFDKNGIMQTAAAGMPRIDYDPVSKQCRGYLLENASTNINQSFFPSNNEWVSGTSLRFVPTGLTDFPTAAVFDRAFTPTGALYAYVQSIQAGIEAGKTYTLTAYIRSSFVPVIVAESHSGGQVVLRIAGSLTSSEYDYRVENLRDDIYKIIATRTVNASDDLGKTGVLSYTVNSELFKKFEVLGIQFEEGTESTSPIITNGSVGARTKDTIRSVTDIVPYIEASMYMNMEYLGSNATTSNAIDKRNTTRFWFTSPSLKFTIYSLFQDTGFYAPNQPNKLQRNKYIASYGTSGQLVGLNGGAIAKKQYTRTGIDIEPLTLFRDGISQRIKSLAIFSRQLTDQEHIDITV